MHYVPSKLDDFSILGDKVEITRQAQFQILAFDLFLFFSCLCRPVTARRWNITCMFLFSFSYLGGRHFFLFFTCLCRPEEVEDNLHISSQRITLTLILNTGQPRSKVFLVATLYLHRFLVYYDS